MTDKDLSILMQLMESASKLTEEEQATVLTYTNAYIDGKTAGIKAAS